MKLSELEIGKCYMPGYDIRTKFLVLEHGFKPKSKREEFIKINDIVYQEVKTAWGEYALVRFSTGNTDRMYMNNWREFTLWPIELDVFLLESIK